MLKSMKELSDSVRDLYGRGISALLSRDLKAASEVISMKGDLDKRQEKFLKILIDHTEDGHTQLKFRTILHGIERMGEYATSIAVIAINRYLERPSNICHPAA